MISINNTGKVDVCKCSQIGIQQNIYPCRRNIQAVRATLLVKFVKGMQSQISNETCIIT